ncbi:MAG: hypothetical protein IKC67_04085 [Odoribacter sp.]|nr:hypothetical protein [Odoribacter sp.]
MKTQTKLSVEQNMPYEAPQLQVTEVKVESGFALSDKIVGGSISSFNPIPW